MVTNSELLLVEDSGLRCVYHSFINVVFCPHSINKKRERPRLASDNNMDV
jgi:hypothetical protein